ncbi:type II secretion system F family protein [Streptomyces albidoflavus]|uniref:type II secretion system F family protein n=1 Tax=Streptomyces albidoflavus TaxID=1886 RepID=UPI00340758FA
MIGALWWAGCGMLLAGGLVALAAGMYGTTREKVSFAAGLRLRGPGAAARRQRRAVLGGLAGGVGLLVWLWSGVFVVGLLLGAAVVGVPWLLTPPSRVRIVKLEALADWAQRLAETLQIGLGLEEALIASRKHAPEDIAEEVRDLAERLRAGWDTREALEEFADRFDDVTADKAAAALILCAIDPGPGLASVLEDLAAQLRSEVSKRREAEADRAKARTSMRILTGITLGVLVVGAGADYAAPYATLTGQLVLLVIGAGFAGALLWARKLATHHGSPRFLVEDPRSQVTLTQEEVTR